MNKKKAREIVAKNGSFKLVENKDYSIPEIIQQAMENDHELGYAQGYLEAIDKAKQLETPLQVALKYIGEPTDTVDIPGIKQLLREALAKWEKEK